MNISLLSVLRKLYLQLRIKHDKKKYVINHLFFTTDTMNVNIPRYNIHMYWYCCINYSEECSTCYAWAIIIV